MQSPWEWLLTVSNSKYPTLGSGSCFLPQMPKIRFTCAIHLKTFSAFSCLPIYEQWDRKSQSSDTTTVGTDCSHQNGTSANSIRNILSTMSQYDVITNLYNRCNTTDKLRQVVTVDMQFLIKATDRKVCIYAYI